MADDDEFTDEQWELVRRGVLAPPQPRRYKTRDELDVEETLAFRRSGQLPETRAYQRARSEALLAAGLSSDEDDAAADREQPKRGVDVRRRPSQANPGARHPLMSVDTSRPYRTSATPNLDLAIPEHAHGIPLAVAEADHALRSRYGSCVDRVRELNEAQDAVDRGVAEDRHNAWLAADRGEAETGNRAEQRAAEQPRLGYATEAYVYDRV